MGRSLLLGRGGRLRREGPVGSPALRTPLGLEGIALAMGDPSAIATAYLDDSEASWVGRASLVQW